MDILNIINIDQGKALAALLIWCLTLIGIVIAAGPNDDDQYGV